MTQIDLFMQHHWLAVFLSFAIFSNLVSTMPSPLPDERLYGWLFAFCHAMAQSIGRVVATNPTAAKFLGTVTTPEVTQGVTTMDVKQAKQAADSAQDSAGKAAELLTPKEP